MFVSYLEARGGGGDWGYRWWDLWASWKRTTKAPVLRGPNSFCASGSGVTGPELFLSPWDFNRHIDFMFLC